MRLPYKTGKVRITSPYGNRVLNGVPGWHAGLDIVSDGDKKICAVMSGVVLQSRMVTDKSNRTWEWGNYVSVQGDDGKIIYYCHMSQRLVQRGQRVAVGDYLGIEGNTGYSFGSHVHFEVRIGSNAIDPAAYLGVRNACQTFPDAAAEWREWYEDQVFKIIGYAAKTRQHVDTKPINEYEYAADFWRQIWEHIR